MDAAYKNIVGNYIQCSYIRHVLITGMSDAMDIAYNLRRKVITFLYGYNQVITRLQLVVTGYTLLRMNIRLTANNFVCCI